MNSEGLGVALLGVVAWLGFTLPPESVLANAGWAVSGALILRGHRPASSRRSFFGVAGLAVITALLAGRVTEAMGLAGSIVELSMLIGGGGSVYIWPLIEGVGYEVSKRRQEVADRIIDKVLPDD